MLLALLVWFVPAVRMACYSLIGRGQGCSVWNAVASAGHIEEQTRTKDRILEASKLIAEGPDGMRQYATPKGSFWIPRGSEYILPFNLAEQELEIYQVGEHRINRGDVVFDCGANVGVFTRKAFSQGASKVIMVEPAPENLECLRRNFKDEIANGSAVLVAKGVWDKEGVLPLQINPESSAADSFVIPQGKNARTIDVPLTTIDILVRELGLAKVDFIKLDIEGAEPQAIDGAKETIKQFKPRISISAYHADDHPQLLPKMILGFRPDYQVVRGPCVEIDRGLRPDTLLFR